MAKWISKSEYARLYELNRSSVTKAVQAGRLPTRGDKVAADVDIRKYRRREPANDDVALRPKGSASVSAVVPISDDVASSRRRREVVAASDLPDEDLGIELQRARIDKLNADIAVQRQKDVRTRQNWRREDLAEFAAAFADCFAPFRGTVVKLRLSLDELATLADCWQTCFDSFVKHLEDMELAADGEDADTPDG